MKKFLPLSIAVFGVAACGPIEFSASKKSNFSVDMVDSTSFSMTKTIDLSQDKDFADYKDHLKSVEISSAVLRITKAPSAQPSACTTASGTVKVGADPTSAGTNLSSFDHLSLTEGTALPLSLDPAGVQVLTGLAINAPNKFTVVTAGTTDEAPCHFEFELDLDIKVQATL